MELLPFNNQFVANLAPHHKQDDVFSFNIVQDAKVADPQLELGKRIGA
jgi:hypothetical protein